MVEQPNSDGSTNVSCTVKSERHNMVIVYIDAVWNGNIDLITITSLVYFQFGVFVCTVRYCVYSVS